MRPRLRSRHEADESDAIGAFGIERRIDVDAVKFDERRCQVVVVGVWTRVEWRFRSRGATKNPVEARLFEVGDHD